MGPRRRRGARFPCRAPPRLTSRATSNNRRSEPRPFRHEQSHCSTVRGTGGGSGHTNQQRRVAGGQRGGGACCRHADLCVCPLSGRAPDSDGDRRQSCSGHTGTGPEGTGERERKREREREGRESERGEIGTTAARVIVELDTSDRSMTDRSRYNATDTTENKRSGCYYTHHKPSASRSRRSNRCNQP